MDAIRNARYQSEPWEMGGPALVGEWIFAIAPNLDSVVQLHRENGRIESTMAIGVGTEWGTPRYLLADDGGDLMPPRLFAVGGDLVAIDPDRPNTALWKLSDVNSEAMRDREGSANRAGIRGRVRLKLALDVDGSPARYSGRTSGPCGLRKVCVGRGDWTWNLKFLARPDRWRA